ncbi:MAG: DUF2505 domain-containing protein [Kineosporiaceae bacterium]
MGQQFRHETPLAAAPDQVVRLMTDPASVTQRYEAAGFTSVAVAASTEGDRLVVETERDETGVLPGPLAKITGGSVHLHQVDRWGPAGSDGSRTATWRISFRGVPGSIEGTICVTPDGDGSLLVHEATVTAGIPLIGGKLESLTIDQTIDKLRVEGRWLTEHV